MATTTTNRPSLAFSREIQEFLIDREARNLTPKTLRWYTDSLKILSDYMEGEGVQATSEIAPSHLRRFILYLTERGHNPGGVKNIFSAVKAYFKWYGDESAPKDWQDPMKKVKTPKRPEQIEEPISLDDFRKLLAACPPRTFAGDRDRAMFLFLLDSGVRQAELADLEIRDVDLSNGQVLVRQGKGRKSRIIFVGAKTRQALVRYLKHRGQVADRDPLWVTLQFSRLTKAGVREIVRRRARQAGISEPGLHEFRRAFALNYLRNGGDLMTLQRLLGHAGLQVIQRYLNLLTSDLQDAHKAHGVVDNVL